MIKYIDQPTFDKQGEPTVRTIYSFDEFIKTANYENYPQDLQDFISNLTSEKDTAFLLISALGCQDWGSNRNADYFPTLGLNHSGRDYGYKTFEYFGHYYKNHINKDPLKSTGKVIKSVWDDAMGRVLLIVKVDLNKDPETSRKLDENEVIAVSMGTKVSFDLCQACHPNWKELYKIPESEMRKIAKSNSLKDIYVIGKKYDVDLSYITKLNSDGGPVGIHSKTSKYCRHIKYQRNQITENGVRATLINMFPKFFDISDVRTNADKSSFVLAKVAHATEDDHITEKELDKLFASTIVKNSGEKKADIKKTIEGDVIAKDVETIKEYFTDNILPGLKDNEKDFPDPVLDQMAKYPLNDILSSMVGMGMFPRPREFQRIVLIQVGKKDLADKYDKEGIHISGNEDIDTSKCDTEKLNIDGEHLNDDIFKMVSPYLLNRSYHRPQVVKRIVIIKKAGEIHAYLNPRTEKRTSNPVIGILAGIAALYALSKTKAGKSLEPLFKAMAENKFKVIASVAGASAAAALISQSGREYQESAMWKKGSPAVAKTVSKLTMKNFGLPIIGVPLATYLYAGHAINKAKSGKKLSLGEGIVASNPMGTSVAGIALAQPGSRKIIFKGLSKLFKGITKAGSMVKLGMDFNGLNLNDFPLEEQDAVVVKMWSEINN